MHGMTTSLNSFSMRCMFELTFPTTRQNSPVGADLGSTTAQRGGGGGGGGVVHGVINQHRDKVGKGAMELKFVPLRSS